MMIRTPNNTPSDFSGETGKAWDISGRAAQLGKWLVQFPQRNPWLSDFHVASIIRLSNPSDVERIDATHEFEIVTLDQISESQFDLDDPTTLHTLSLDEATDIKDQLVLSDDTRAIQVARLALEKCVNGGLIPDNSDMQQWVEFFRTQE